MNNVTASFKFFSFIILCAVIVPAQSVLLFIHKGKNAYFLPFLWQKGVCAIFGIKVHITGKPYTKSQTLYMSNHTSYLDIPAIGSVLKASFVAKEDVASWPVFGFLSKLQQTAFISRNRAKATTVKNALETILDDGKSLIIFPEGTSTEGTEVLPFKASLFSLAFRENTKAISIQPITLNIKTVDNKEIKTQEERNIYAWPLHMDTPLGEHLWRFAQSRGAEIELHFHAPVKASNFADRKMLAKACYNTVSNGLTSLNTRISK